MTYVFDIDGTICETNDSDYKNSKPLLERIKKVNALYDEGHTILFLTARGMGRTKNNQSQSHNLLYEFTEKQLTDWGVKFHKLFLGKPSGDIYIDDKGMKDENFFRNELCP
jgi:histidinol phosphatase-like enzyme